MKPWSRLAGIVATCLVLGCEGRPKKALGGDCTDDMACDSLTCSTAGNVCSHSCTYDRECQDVAVDAVCRRREEGGNWCSKPIGAAPNQPCEAAKDCQHNECLLRPRRKEEPGICSKACQTSSDCPPTMQACVTVGESSSRKVCVPGNPAVASSVTAAELVRAPLGEPAAGEPAAGAPAAGRPGAKDPPSK